MPDILIERNHALDPRLQRPARVAAVPPDDPRGLDQQAAWPGGPGFRDPATALALPRAVFVRHQAKERGGATRIAKAAHVIDRRAKRERGDRPDARRGHQLPHYRVGGRRRRHLRVQTRQHRLQLREQVEDRLQRRLEAGRHGHARIARRDRFRAAAAQPVALLPQLRAQQIDRLRAHAHQLLPHAQPTTALALDRRHAMRRSINPQPTRLGQRRHIPAVGFDPPLPLPIHQGVIGIRDDHRVPAPCDHRRHPLTLGPGFHQHSQRSPSREHTLKGLGRGRNPLLQNHPAVDVHDANQARPRV